MTNSMRMPRLVSICTRLRKSSDCAPGDQCYAPPPCRPRGALDSYRHIRMSPANGVFPCYTAWKNGGWTDLTFRLALPMFLLRQLFHSGNDIIGIVPRAQKISEVQHKAACRKGDPCSAILKSQGISNGATAQPTFAARPPPC
jgi:hypothetical protein